MINVSNILVQGSHGKIGNLIFRRWGDKTVISQAPSSGKRRWSKAQEANRLRFSAAMAYSRKALKDPEMRKYYQKQAKGMQTLWNVAVADYMKRPVVEKIDLSHYSGNRGDTIHLRAIDNYRVAALVVTILNAQGIAVESGTAAPTLNRKEWIYTITTHFPGWRNGRIQVCVTDTPGNAVKAIHDIASLKPPG